MTFSFCLYRGTSPSPHCSSSDTMRQGIGFLTVSRHGNILLGLQLRVNQRPLDYKIHQKLAEHANYRSSERPGYWNTSYNAMAISFVHLASQSSQMLSWHRIMWSNFGRNPSKPVEFVRQSEGKLVFPSHNPELHITNALC